VRRRDLLRGCVTAGAVGLSGCLGLLETRSARTPPVPENRPDGAYVPSHVEGTSMQGTATAGDYAFGLTYSYPHRFWTVSGTDVSLTRVRDDDDVHLMAVVWDPVTRTVLPDTGLSLEITRDGELVSQEVIYPMLSQPMGFHYGANFGLAGDGSYTVQLSVAGVATRRTGAFRDRFDEPATAELPLEYSERARDDLPYELLGDRTGTRGVVDRRTTEAMPDSRAPPPAEMPGRTLGAATSDDARFVAVLTGPPAGVSVGADGDADGRYLAVSPRTRYHGTVLPAMELAATLVRDGDTVHEATLTRTLDPDLGYHYGTLLGDEATVRSGDELVLSVRLQPQTARHEGYETAFGGIDGEFPDARIAVE
jgi:hypothetical protein